MTQAIMQPLLDHADFLIFAGLLGVIVELRNIGKALARRP